MKVGISMSLRSCDPLLRSPPCCRGRAASGVAGRAIVPVRRGRLPGKGITGEPLAMTGGCSCDGVLVPCCSARSNPVAMTVTRISPCIADDFVDLMDLTQREISAARDVHEHTGGAGDADVIEQR